MNNRFNPEHIAHVLNRDLGAPDIIPPAPAETGDFPTEGRFTFSGVDADGVWTDAYEVRYDPETGTYGGFSR